MLVCEPGRDREAHALLRAALRPVARSRRGGGGRAARGDPGRPRRRRLARPRPHPAQPARPDRRHAAHERVQAPPRRHRLQAAFGRRARDPPTGAQVRDLRLLADHGGDPPARQRDCARRDPLVGPHGLPHRGLRPDARAADEERRDRARRREGRLLPPAPAGRPRRGQGRGRAPVRALHQRAARADRQPRRRRGRASGGPARARRRGHLPRRRRRQGHRDVLGHRQPRRRGARLLAGRRVRLRRIGGLRPQGARDHCARRLGVGQAPLPGARPRPGRRRVHGRRHRRHERRRVRQRHAAVEQDPSRRRLRPPARVHRSVARRGRHVRGAQAAVRPRRLVVGRLRPGEDLGGRRRLAAQRQEHPALRAGARRARDRGRGTAAQRGHPRDPARAGRPAVERRHRHGRQGIHRVARRRAGPRVGGDPRERRRAARPRRGGGRQPRPHPRRPHRIQSRAAGV